MAANQSLAALGGVNRQALDQYTTFTERRKELEQRKVRCFCRPTHEHAALSRPSLQLSREHGACTRVACVHGTLPEEARSAILLWYVRCAGTTAPSQLGPAWQPRTVVLMPDMLTDCTLQLIRH